MTFVSQLCGLCFPSEGRRDLSRECFIAGVTVPGTWVQWSGKERVHEGCQDLLDGGQGEIWFTVT